MPPLSRTLPANDPLFVAEFNPALAQLERPALMRSFGLILENLDGFSNPTTKFVMRGVPHTLGLQVSLEQDTTLVPAPAEMTGWSGDGAPGTGLVARFRDRRGDAAFHEASSTRVAGTDFTLPKAHQLDAMEAFQLSLGRSRDVDLSRVTFQATTTNLNAGKDLFINGGGDPRTSAARAISVIPTAARSPPAFRTRTATSTRMSKTGGIPRGPGLSRFQRTAVSGETTTGTARSATGRSTPRPS